MADYLIIEECPLCGFSDSIKILKVSDYRGSGEQFTIWECKKCSLRFTSPIPDENHIQKYYETNSYVSHSAQPDSIIDKIYKLVQKITLRSKKSSVEKWSDVKCGATLDIGCGTGDFLNKMKMSGWEVEGIEVNQSARQIAQNKINKNILAPKDFLKSDNQFDVITLWHSLEHLHDLHKYVGQIKGSLKQNGTLFVAVPNYNSFDAEYYRSNWAAYDVPRHLYHFSFESMKILLKEYGFELMKYRQLPFDPFYISLMSETAVKNKGSIIRASWIGLRSFVSGLFNPKKGSSILYIIRKGNN